MTRAKISFPAGISGNGRVLVLRTSLKLKPDDTDTYPDVYAAGALLPLRCQNRVVTHSRPPFVGGAGIDVMLGTAGSDVFTGNGADDFICAGSGNDTINGGPANDRMLGEGGHDTFIGGAGNDIHVGGVGVDMISFGGSVPIVVDLSIAAAQGTGQGSDTFVSVENANGSSAVDRLTGSAAANRLSGLRGR